MRSFEVAAWKEWGRRAGYGGIKSSQFLCATETGFSLSKVSLENFWFSSSSLSEEFVIFFSTPTKPFWWRHFGCIRSNSHWGPRKAAHDRWLVEATKVRKFRKRRHLAETCFSQMHNLTFRWGIECGEIQLKIEYDPTELMWMTSYNEKRLVTKSLVYRYENL